MGFTIFDNKCVRVYYKVIKKSLHYFGRKRPIIEIILKVNQVTKGD